MALAFMFLLLRETYLLYLLKVSSTTVSSTMAQYIYELLPLQSLSFLLHTSVQNRDLIVSYFFQSK